MVKFFFLFNWFCIIELLIFWEVVLNDWLVFLVIFKEYKLEKFGFKCKVLK